MIHSTCVGSCVHCLRTMPTLFLNLTSNRTHLLGSEGTLWKERCYVQGFLSTPREQHCRGEFFQSISACSSNHASVTWHISGIQCNCTLSESWIGSIYSLEVYPQWSAPKAMPDSPNCAVQANVLFHNFKIYLWNVLWYCYQTWSSVKTNKYMK